jgi:hypothetical protein
MLIDPPDNEPIPKWASTLVNAANSHNHARASDVKFTADDLIAVWAECGGRCAVSGLPFSSLVVGDGQAKRPFAPSLDRIDRHKPYSRENVRLVCALRDAVLSGSSDAVSVQFWDKLCAGPIGKG